jgi:hypothetical protein
MRHGLPGVEQAPIDLVTDDPEAVAVAVAMDGLAGFLATAIDDGLVRADDAVASQVLVAWRHALVNTVRVEAHAVRIAAALDDAVVRWRLTKGAAIAHLDYPHQLSARTFGDVDVIVHPADWATTLDVLGAIGYRRPAPELRPGFDRRFGKGATLVDDRELEVDLHLRFAIGRFGVRSRMEELFDRADRVEVGGRRLPTLDGPDRLLHACHHLVLGGFSGLRAARDVAQLLLSSDVDWHRTVGTATRWSVAPVVARGFTRAWERLDLGVAHPAVDWAHGLSVGRADRTALDVFEQERPFREQALTAVPALPARAVPRYLLALAVPQSTARNAGEGSALRAALSRVERLRRSVTRSKQG